VEGGIAGLPAGGGVIGLQQALEVDRGRRGEQLELQTAGVAASAAVGAVAFELGDRALGVRLTIERRVAARWGAHSLSRFFGRRVLGARLRRDQRNRLERVQCGVGVLAARRSHCRQQAPRPCDRRTARV
jgi:hypothetical protein